MARFNGVAAGAGGFVLLGASALLFLVTQITKNQLSLVPRPTYGVTARFENIADLKVGAHVAMAGVNIGRVAGIAFDAVEHQAVVQLRLDTAFSQIPRDSTASITTQGVLGHKFISVTNGSSEIYLTDQDRIVSTRSAIPLESLVSQLVVRYLKGKSATAHGQPATPAQPEATPDGR